MTCQLRPEPESRPGRRPQPPVGPSFMVFESCLSLQAEFALSYVEPVIRKRRFLLALVAALLDAGGAAEAQGRLPRIRQRGVLVCGVAPGIAGFAHVDDHARYSGFDIDICRALSAAI